MLLMNSLELISLPARSPEHAGSEGGVATAAPATQKITKKNVLIVTLSQKILATIPFVVFYYCVHISCIFWLYLNKDLMKK